MMNAYYLSLNISVAARLELRRFASGATQECCISNTRNLMSFAIINIADRFGLPVLIFLPKLKNPRNFV